jgi:hypothetical protein
MERVCSKEMGDKNAILLLENLMDQITQAVVPD